MKRRIFLLIVTVVMAATSCDPDSRRDVVVGEPAGAEGSEAGAASTPRPTRQTATATTILVDGRLEMTKPMLPLSFTTGGLLLRLTVTAGDRVQTGDLIGELDDEVLQQALESAKMQVTQAENGLAQAQLALDDLLSWEPDELAVSAAEANLAAAEANLARAAAVDEGATNSLVSARISVEQAERYLASVQEAYDVAYDPGREWETYMVDPDCLPGQGGAIPCTGVPRSVRIQAERDGADQGLVNARESLTMARANYNLALSGLNDDSAVSAEASVASAEQSLAQAKKGPRGKDIEAARLQVTQAELTVDQAAFNAAQAEAALSDAFLYAPWDGTVMQVHVLPGASVGPGTAIITLADTTSLQFLTTNLSERDLAEVTAGLAVEMSLKAYPGESIEGAVLRIEPQASGMIGDAATFTVVIELKGSDLLLLPGMTGRAEIRR